MKYHVLAALLLIIMALYAQAAQAQPTRYTLTHDGLTRNYLLTIPSSVDPQQPAPLLIALHPIMSSANAMRALTGLDTTSALHGMVVAYPQAHSGYWDDGRSTTNLYAPEGSIDDLGFLATLIEDIAAHTSIDNDRVYLTGLGNGGTLALHAACQMPEHFAGIAVIGALLRDYQTISCPDAPTPLDLLIVHGTADTFYRIEGRDLRESPLGTAQAAMLSLNETLRFWQERYACGQLETPYEGQSFYFYAGCQDEARLMLYSILGADNGWPRHLETHLNDFNVDVTDIIVRFLMEEPITPEQITQQRPSPDELARSYTLYVPNDVILDAQLPLVVVLHGRPGSGAGIAVITDMNTIADRHGFAVVYPDGLEDDILRSWNYGRDIPIYPAEPTPIGQRDDAQFMRDLVQHVSQLLPIDQQRVYVTGFSNGGFMTQRLACEAPETFAAFAAVGATLSWGFNTLCLNQPPVSLLIMHGTEDVSIPWTGTTAPLMGRETYITAPIPNTMAFWAQHNQCQDAAPIRNDVPKRAEDAPTRISIFTYDACAAPLVLVGIEGGGHNWPGVPDRISDEIAGNVNMDIHAGEVIWRFFEQFALSAPPTAD